MGTRAPRCERDRENNLRRWYTRDASRRLALRWRHSETRNSAILTLLLRSCVGCSYNFREAGPIKRIRNVRTLFRQVWQLWCQACVQYVQLVMKCIMRTYRVTDISVVHRLCHSLPLSFTPSSTPSVRLSRTFCTSLFLPRCSLQLLWRTLTLPLVDADTDVFVEFRRIYAAPSLHNHRHVRDARTRAYTQICSSRVKGL